MAHPYLYLWVQCSAACNNHLLTEIAVETSVDRLDKTLFKRGLATSRAHAQRLIAAGRVCVNGQVQPKASALVAADSALTVAPGDEDRYVSRGGLKLAGAMVHCALDVKGMTVLDVGQSTGGFTDCLLQAGAANVVGVDVGRDQLTTRLKEDARVSYYEGINARELPLWLRDKHAPEGFDLAVMDISFISQTLVLPALVSLLASGGLLLSLVKPQFEVGRENIGKGGIVRNAALYSEVEQTVKTVCYSLGLTVQDYFDSPITGGDGNCEFFMLCKKSYGPD